MAKLSESEYRTCIVHALKLVSENKCVTNREIRESTGISYDQAIAFFNRAIKEGALQRTGSSSATKYVIPARALPLK